LTEKEAHKYIEVEYGRKISSKNYYTIKSKLEAQAEETSLLWLNEFTRIGFVTQHRRLIDNIERIYQDNLNRFFIESRKDPSIRNEDLLLKLNANIRENTTLLQNLGVGSPVIAGIKAKLQRYEENQFVVNSPSTSSTPTSELQEGLLHQPWDDHDWSRCNKCQKWYRSELTEGSCNNCANLPEAII
jgi:hypothetical protein